MHTTCNDFFVFNYFLKDHSKRNWTLYEAYNPSKFHGGDLKVTLIGFYNKIEGYRLLQKGGKYLKRRNMTGVALQAQIVVNN